MHFINILHVALLVTSHGIASPLVPSQFPNPSLQIGPRPTVYSSEEAPNPILRPSAPAEPPSPNPPPSDGPVSPLEAPDPTFGSDANNTTVPLEAHISEPQLSAPTDSLGSEPQLSDSPVPSSEALTPISQASASPFTVSLT